MGDLIDALAIPIGVVVGERIAHANVAMAELGGSVGTHWLSMFAAGDHETLASALVEAQAGQRQRHQALCPDRAVEVTLNPVVWQGVSAVAITIEDIDLRVALRSRLVESENRLQRLASSVRVPIVAADTRGRIVLWNEAATRTLGYTELEVHDEPFAMLFFPETAGQFSDDRFARGELEVLGRTTLLTVRHKAGLAIPAQVSFASSDFGGARWFTAVIHDDTERQHLIDSHARSEASFRELVEQSPDPLFVLGPKTTDHDIIYANAATHTLLGYERGTLIGRCAVGTFMHPDDRALIESYRERRRAGGYVPPAQIRWIRADGEIIDMQTMSRQIRFADQPATLVSGRDVTAGVRRERERAEAEAVLRNSEERYRALFEANPLPAWLLDPETGIFVAVNEAMVRTFGYTRDELLRTRIHALEADADRDRHDRSGDAAIGNVEHIGIRRHRRKNGTLVDMDITVHPIPFEGRTVILGIGRDVTNELQLEEQLRQTQKMDAIGQLAGGIAHDFNNILAVIIANTSLALDELGPDHPAAGDLGEIETAAARASGLTRQLLAFSRKARREVRHLALNTIVTNVERMLSRIVGEDVLICAHLESKLATIEGDAGQIEQILVNLVVNARDAMPSGGRITIETANTTVDELQGRVLGVAPGDYVSLAVTDTGYGIAESVRPRIFEPFFTTKEVGKGTGLGLSTVFGIVKQSAGGIEVQSELERGTTLRVYFPRAQREPDAVAAPGRFVAPAGRGTVLVVEDDTQLRHVVRRHLAKWGFSLLEAPNGRAALEVARTFDGPIDLLLTDLVMPELDGRSLANQLLATRPATRVIFMSGYTQHPMLHDAEEGFLQKPFTTQFLAEAVRRALGAPSR